VQSMTGYGRGEASNSQVTVVVELKSVNNRFRDIQLRCPKEYMALEPRINTMLKEPFQRGRIDAHIGRSSTGASKVVVADARLAMEYMKVINDAAEAMVGFVVRDIPFTFILSQPGVLNVQEARVDVMSEQEIVETALQSAIADLSEMRKKEGKNLKEDLSGHLEAMMELLGAVSSARDSVNQRLEDKLQTRLQRLLGERVDPFRLAQEAAILADKADVSEEIARLGSHCEQFREALELGVPIGRRLEFLLQEMNREVNTIGSKASEHPVSRSVVEMKTVLERMREQAANVQ